MLGNVKGPLEIRNTGFEVRLVIVLVHSPCSAVWVQARMEVILTRKYISERVKGIDDIRNNVLIMFTIKPRLNKDGRENMKGVTDKQTVQFLKLDHSFV